MPCSGWQAKATGAGRRDNSGIYLVDWECVWIPGIDSGLIDIHNSNFDTGAHLRNNTTSWPTNVTSTNAANLLNFKHDCSNKRRGKWKIRNYKLKYRPTIQGKQRVFAISDFIMLRPAGTVSYGWSPEMNCYSSLQAGKALEPAPLRSASIHRP